MDTAQWTQETGVEKSVAVANTSYTRQVIERKVRPQKDQAINCPRCHSTNTKFCYYNNYSQTQPRYFCKACRRYWTEGGTLRNVPVGGGSRKNKRSSSISTSPSLTISTTSNPLQSHKIHDLNPPNPKINHDHRFSSDQNPRIHHDHQGQDLNLGYPAPHDFHHNRGVPQFYEFPKIFETRDVINTASSSNSPSASAHSISALNLLRTGIGLNSFIPMAPGSLDQTNAFFASSFPFNQECKPALGFSFDGVNGSRLYATPNLSQGNNINGSPFGSTKQHQNESDQGKLGHENSNGYWNGMLGGGSW